MVILFFSAPGGDFQRVLDEDQVPFEQDVQRYLRQVAEGLQFMHQLNIAHLDIKVILCAKYIMKTKISKNSIDSPMLNQDNILI